jgi:hypothetical protein
MASSLRSTTSTKITFFVFLDIITAVTGIFIFIVLLLSFRLQENGSTPGAATASGMAGDAASESELNELLHRLEALVATNHARQIALAEAETAPNLADLSNEIDTLKAAIARERSDGARLQVDARSRELADAARDDAVGLTADRAQIQHLKEHLAALEAENTGKHQQSEALENEVKQAEARLLDAQARRGNRLWLVPDLPATSKEPILVIVSGHDAVAERFNKPDSRVSIGSKDGADAFKKLLARYNKLDDYFVFYVRPSGIECFEDYLNAARDAGFEVGYDAIEENRELIFSLPKD